MLTPVLRSSIISSTVNPGYSPARASFSMAPTSADWFCPAIPHLHVGEKISGQLPTVCDPEQGRV